MAKKEIKESKKLDEQTLVQIFKDAYQESDTAYRPQKAIADDAWACYNNQYDFSDKADWQSKNALPKFKTAIRIAHSLLKQSLIQAPKVFTLEGLNEESRIIERDVELAMSQLLEQSEFKQKISESLLGGLLESLMCMKIFPSKLSEEDPPIHPEQIYKMIFVPIMVSNDIRIDPRGRDLYKLHRTVLDLPDYEKKVHEGIYSQESLDHVKSDFGKQEEQYRENIRQNKEDAAKPSWRKEVEIWENWFRYLCDAEGNIAYENVTFSVVNQKAIARFPIDFPFAHKKPPFVIAPVVQKAFSVYHESFGEGVLGLVKMMVDLINQIVDSIGFATANAFELNLDYIRNATEMKSGIYPAKIVKTRGVPPGTQVVRPFEVGQFKPEAINFLSYIDREFQNGIGITELIAGLPGMGEKTATEVASKTRQAMGIMRQIAQDIEDNYIAKCISMAYDLALEWNPEIFGNRVYQVPKKKLKFKMEVRGMSGVLERQGEIQAILMFINIVSKTPLAQRLNWKYLGDKLVEANNWRSDDIFLKDQLTPNQPGQTIPAPVDEQDEQGKQNIQNIVDLQTRIK